MVKTKVMSRLLDLANVTLEGIGTSLRYNEGMTRVSSLASFMTLTGQV